nr:MULTISPECIES: tlde1 domain-containing protein [unclassified Burkholderia]
MSPAVTPGYGDTTFPATNCWPQKPLSSTRPNYRPRQRDSAPVTTIDSPAAIRTCLADSRTAFAVPTPYVNNPDATALVDNGPRPKGMYYIVNRQSGGRLGWLWDSLRDHAIVNGIKRGNFRLHPNGLLGVCTVCIALVSKSQFKLRRFLLAQPPKLIPGTNIRHYGTVLVR